LVQRAFYRKLAIQIRLAENIGRENAQKKGEDGKDNDNVNKSFFVFINLCAFKKRRQGSTIPYEINLP
jgi:hypothetical protein